MARTIEEIISDIDFRANQHEALAGLQNRSVSGYDVWNNMKTLIATLIQSTELGNEAHTADIDRLIASQEIGNAQWYKERALEFQYDPNTGYPLGVVDNRIGYEVVDVSKRIITDAAVVTQSGGKGIEFRLVRGTGENRIYLSAPERSAFEAYMNKVKFMGVPIMANTATTPDSVSLEISFHVQEDVWRNRITASGTPRRFTSEGQTEIEKVLKQVFNAVPLDGKVFIKDIEGALEAIPGIVDAQVTGRRIKVGGGTITASWTRPARLPFESSGGLWTYIGAVNNYEVRFA